MSEEVKYISKIKIEDNNYNIKDDNVREAVGYYEEEVPLVDLGLPSGTLWAKTNIGADSETDFGLYFAWGETEGYTDTSLKAFDWNDYKYGTYDNITKYNDSDGLTLLTNEDDAAYANSDGLLRMPTKEEIKELCDYTFIDWTTINGISGRKFTNWNDSSKYIFIPAAGFCRAGSVTHVGDYLYLLSSSRDSDARYSLDLDSSFYEVNMSIENRCYGRSVRGVSRKATTPKSTKADKVRNCLPGNFPSLDATGNLVDSGVSKDSLSNYYEKNQNILIDETGIYQVKDSAVYPVSHPDLSTQPSILPLRYGNLDINEVLISNGRESEIPKDATIISAFSFNKTICVPAVCEKESEGSGWSIYNFMNIVPEFTLIQYVGADNGSYYYPSGGDGDDFIIPEFIDEDDGELVDLGLPSGTLWAKSNLGASSPSQYGLYYAWGETTGYSNASSGKAFSWNDYKYMTLDNITKYNDSDGLTQLSNDDDAVYQSTYGNLVMPTQEQLEELKNNTYSVWYTTQTGVKGRMFISKVDNSKYIFIPAAGICSNGSVIHVGSYCYLWSSSRYSSAYSAWYLFCNSSGVDWSDSDRRGGRSVRGCKIPVKGDVQIFDNPECTRYATGVKEPGDKIYARVNVPWDNRGGWESQSVDITQHIVCQPLPEYAGEEPFTITLYDNFISNEYLEPFTAGQVVELTFDYYIQEDITNYQKVFTKPN